MQSTRAAGAETRDKAAVRAFRDARSKSESPRVLFWIGAAIFMLSVINIAVGALTVRTFLLHLSISVIVWIGGWVISRPWCPDSKASLITGFCSLVVILEFEYEYWIDPTPLGFGYILMIMIGGATIVLSPLLVGYIGSIGILGSVLIVAAAPHSVLAPGNDGDWILAAVTASVIGYILLFQRLRSIDELGEVTRRAKLAASTDTLTGLLNRRGLEEVMTAQVTLARVSRDTVHACFVDIDWLKTANDTYGHEFGDSIIVAVADAVRACVHEGDSIARWGGDEFLVFGRGPAHDDDALHDRIIEHLRASDFDFTRWPGTVSIGSATASSIDLQLHELIQQADVRMYERRRAQRTQA